MSRGIDIWDEGRSAPGGHGPSHERKRLYGSIVASLFLTAVFLVSFFLPWRDVTIPGNLLLPLHTILELLSVLVSVMIFTLTWNLRWRGKNSRATVIGAGFLAIAFITLVHAFAFQGIPGFLTPNTPAKAVFFGLVARYLTVAALMAVAVLPNVRWSQKTCYSVLAGVILVSIAIWIGGTYYLDRLPPLYVEGQGLTSLDVWAEYVATALFAVAAVILGVTAYRTRHRRRLWVAASAWSMFLSELYFGHYVNVMDIANFYGHVFKAIAFIMLFRAVFVAGMREPYIQLDLERSWLEALLVSAPSPIWLKTPEGVYLSCNRAMEGLVGQDLDRIAGRTDYDLFDKDLADQFRENDLLALNSSSVNVNEERVNTADKGWRLLETSKTAVRLPDGTLLGVLGIAHDITDQRAASDRLQKLAGELAQENTERRQVEARLVAANAMYDAVIRCLPIALMVVDPEGVVLTWNEAARKTFGHGETEVVGGSGRAVFADFSRPAFEAALRDAVGGRTRAAMEVVCIREGDIGFPALLHQAVVRAPGGEVSAIIFAIEDVSERRSIEAQLRQSQKMEAIGQLTAGIAHDFNNILAIIAGNLELLLEDDGQGSSTRPLARGALNASMRGAALTQRLLAYSRQQTLEPSITNVARMLAAEDAILRRTLEESITIDMVLPDDLWSVRVDVTRLQDSILNLVLNARDSMPRGGRLTISAENVTLDDDYCAHQLEVTPGDYVKLSIVDTGIGMTGETLGQVLEPFFTTKPMGQGSGLGLSMVYGFVKQSGGHLEIGSKPGVGTTVSLYLPRSRDGAPPGPAARSQDSQPPAPAAGEGILLVEDDTDVREMLVTYLNGLGYRVVETRDGKEALAALQSDNAFSMIVTDVVLPGGMRGPDIVAAAEGIRPGLKVLYISGYSENALTQHGELLEGIHLLTKPFRMKDLARKMRDLLDA